MSPWIIAAAILGVIAGLLYNFLINRKNQVDNIYAGIDALLKKRYDLIPNLVATVKRYADHERQTLEEVTGMRAQAMRSDSQDKTMELNAKLSTALGGLMVNVEAYPELKANENFIHMQKTLHELESQISAARRAFNQAVTDYNNAIEMFPTNILANMMGYKRKGVYEAEDVERKAPDVNGLFNR